MTMTNKVKRGDAVVLEHKHSYHTNAMKKVEYSTFQIAKATKVERGIVKLVQLPGGEKPAILGSYRVLTVTGEEHQEGARRLLRKVTPAENNWPDAESMKKAILEAFQWDRVL
jgi:hypothetical protein